MDLDSSIFIVSDEKSAVISLYSCVFFCSDYRQGFLFTLVSSSLTTMCPFCYLSCLGFSKLLGSLAWFSLFWQILSHYPLKYFSSFVMSLFSFVELHLRVHYTVWYCPKVHGCSIFSHPIHSFPFLCISVWIISTNLSLSLLSCEFKFLQLCQVYW